MRAQGSILGGLPVVVDFSAGYDSWNMEDWAEVNTIYWRKRDGQPGKAIPKHLRDKAEKYDPYFSDLLQNIFESMSAEQADDVAVVDFD